MKNFLVVLLALGLLSCGKDKNKVDNNNNNNNIPPIVTPIGGVIPVGAQTADLKINQLLSTSPCPAGAGRFPVHFFTTSSQGAATSSTLLGPFNLGQGPVGAAQAVYVGQDLNFNDFMVVRKYSTGNQLSYSIELHICEQPALGIVRTMQIRGLQVPGIMLRDDTRCSLGFATSVRGVLYGQINPQQTPGFMPVGGQFMPQLIDIAVPLGFGDPNVNPMTCN